MFFQPDLLHSRNQTIAQVIGGAIGLSWKGPAALTLSATNTFTGAVSASAGTLKAGTAASPFGVGPAAGSPTFGSGSVVALNGTAVLDLNGFNVTLGNFTGVSTSAVSLGAATLTCNGNSFSPVFAGVIGGTGNVIKATTVPQTFSGANTYTGTTTITAGTLTISTIANGGLPSGIGASSNANTNLIFGGGVLGYNGGGSVSTDRNYTITAGSSAGFRLSPSGTSLALNGVSAATTGAFILSNSVGSKLILNGNNLHTGLTTVTSGTLEYGVNNALSSGGINVNGASSIVDIKTFSDTVGALTISTGGTFNGTTGILTSTVSPIAAQSGTINAILSGAVGLTKSSTGTVTITSACTYTGAVTLSAGILEVTSVANTGVGSPLGTGSSGSLLLTGGILRYTGSGHSTNRNPQISVASSLDASGSGALTLTGAPVWGTAAVLTLTGTGSGFINGTLDGGANGRITKAGLGTWTLAGTNTYTGPTLVNAGILLVTGSIASGSAITVSGGILGGTGTLNGAPTIANVAGSYLMGGLGAGSTGTLSLNAGATFAGSSSGILVNTNGTTGVSVLSWGALLATQNLNGVRVNFGAGQLLNAGTNNIFTLGLTSGFSGSATVGTPPANRSSLSVATAGTNLQTTVA